jgi:hypothetical protein
MLPLLQLVRINEWLAEEQCVLKVGSHEAARNRSTQDDTMVQRRKKRHFYGPARRMVLGDWVAETPFSPRTATLHD